MHRLMAAELEDLQIDLINSVVKQRVTVILL